MFRIFRKKRELSLLEAISSMLSAQALERAALRCSDWRDLIEVAAGETNKYSARQFASKVASLIGLSFEERIEVADLSLLEAGVTIKDLIRIGMIPVTSEGKVEALVCVDPARLKSLRSAYLSLPRRLALWSSIRVALEESERLHRRRASRNCPSPVSSLHEAVRSLLGMLVSEVESYGQSNVTIEFGLEAIRYQFLTRDRQVAQGELSLKIRTPMLALLERAATAGHSVDVQVEKSVRELEIQSLEGVAKRVLVTWSRGEENPTGVAEEKSALEVVGKGKVASLKVSGKDRGGLLDRNRQVESASHQTVIPEQGSGITVLILDDNLTFLSVLGRFFTAREMQVVSFSDPTKALAELVSGALAPDAIICDVHMPGKSGIDFIREARTVVTCQAVPAIMLTSDDDVETELRALAQGADAFVLKNEDPRVLMAYVERLLGRRAAA